MTIVVFEGPDNAGKTTAATAVTRRLHGLYVKTEVRPVPGDYLMYQYHHSLRILENYTYLVVSDRHHAISEPIYGKIVRGKHTLTENGINYCAADCVVVYCRPPTDRILDFQDREQMAGVVDNARAIIAEYDKVIMRLPFKSVIKYDFTTNRLEDLCQAIAKEMMQR